jgi:hypothetical protein
MSRRWRSEPDWLPRGKTHRLETMWDGDRTTLPLTAWLPPLLKLWRDKSAFAKLRRDKPGEGKDERATYSTPSGLMNLLFR